jgi:choline dehydrogenase-like flavoprotein
MNQYLDDHSPAGRFDYLVVGAGSAGCAVARRLLDHTDGRVLVLEAGGELQGIESISDPARWAGNIGARWTWPYSYAAGPHIDNRVIGLPRGKVLGGSGSINAVVWARGHRSDYDGWAAAGNPGWDYDSVLPLFRKSEDWEGGASQVRGAGGPIHVERAKHPSLLASALIDASVAFGMPYVDDLNGTQQAGVGPLQVNVRDGGRCDPWSSYLLPVAGSTNLTLLTGAQAVRLRLTGTRCTGVDYLRDGKLQSATVSREVILAAGAIDSPRLLLLSGIGPHDDLKRIGISTALDLPGVGRNLQDHIMLAGMYFEAKRPSEMQTYGRGRASCFWPSRADLAAPDLMLMLTQKLPTAPNEPHNTVPENAFAMVPGLVGVASRGHLRLLNAAHDGPLEVQPNFLAEQADIDALLLGVELGFEIASQPALREIIKAPLSPVRRQSRAEAEAFLRRSCLSYFHPVGTCAMGRGTDAVVGADLRVHGIEGLRVADASIMPRITSAHTHAPTIMIGEFAAQAIIAGASVQARPALTGND